MNQVSIYAIPPLVSALFLFSLGVVTLVSTGNKRVWNIFAVFCFVVGVSAAFGFFAEIGRETPRIGTYVKLELFFALISLSFANFYGMELTGFRFGATARHKRIKKALITTIVSIWLIVIVLMFLTDQVIERVMPLANHGVRMHYGPVMWVLLGIFFVGTMRNLVFLVSAYRKSGDSSFRQFLGLNVVAFHLIFAPAIWLVFVLPVFGLPTQLIAFLAFPVSVIVFYVAIVHFQVDQVKELNVTLEQKVIERTEELRRTQTRLAQSERMAALSRLVAGVAHEMNNPVGAVQSMADSMTTAVERLKTRVRNNDADESEWNRFFAFAEDAGSVLRDGTRRITHVVEDLRKFARLDEAVLQKTNLNSELNEAVDLLKGILKPEVTVRREFGEVPDILCYPAQLNQVFLNLLVNANDAVGEQGTIVISTAAGDGRVKIGIGDDGEGIPEEYLEKVFEPGFTTKGAGVGTGLGLAICYRIVQEHRGEIAVSSAVGKGSTFTIALPAGSPGAG
jgi:signal transduction histidine kinase